MKLYITDTEDTGSQEWSKQTLEPKLDRRIEWTPVLHESDLCVTRVNLKCTMRTKRTTVWITYSQIDDEVTTLMWETLGGLVDYLNHQARKENNQT